MRSPFVGGVPSPAPLERAGTVPSRAGPHFFEEIGERTPRGRRFLPLGTPFSGGRNGGRWLVRYWPGLRPPRPTPHGPPTSSGGREKWFINGRRKREPERLLSAFFPKGTLSHPQPAQPVGGPLPAFQREGRRPGTKKEVQPPPHYPTREGGPGGGTSSPGGSFPHFFPRTGAPAGQAPVPARSNGEGNTPQPPPT